jgi:hypothetical protein
MTYSFTPEDRYEQYHARRKNRTYTKRAKDGVSWRAPEHSKLTSDMQRDFPRDDFGVPLTGSKKEFLVVDPRPTIMKPVRETVLGWL